MNARQAPAGANRTLRQRRRRATFAKRGQRRGPRARQACPAGGRAGRAGGDAGHCDAPRAAPRSDRLRRRWGGAGASQAPDSKWLSSSDLPKLFINADPGSILTGKQREFCRSWPNQEEVTVKGTHFMQEDSPDEIGKAVSRFVSKLRGN